MDGNRSSPTLRKTTGSRTPQERGAEELRARKHRSKASSAAAPTLLRLPTSHGAGVLQPTQANNPGTDRKAQARAEHTRGDASQGGGLGPRLDRVQLRVDVDFAERKLRGRALLYFQVPNALRQPGTTKYKGDASDTLELRINLRCCAIQAVTVNDRAVEYRLQSPLDGTEVMQAIADRIYPPPTMEELEMMLSRQARHAAHGELLVFVPWSILGASRTAEPLPPPGDPTAATNPVDVTGTPRNDLSKSSSEARSACKDPQAEPVSVAEADALVDRIPRSETEPRSTTAPLGTKIDATWTKPTASIGLRLQVEYTTLPESPAVHFCGHANGEPLDVFDGSGAAEDALLFDQRLPEQQQLLLQQQPLPILVEHMYVESHSGLASTWMPCLNPPNAVLANSGVRCAYDLEIIVPTGMIAVASGELKGSSLEESTEAGRASRTRFVFQVPEPVLASDIAFSAGLFRVLPDRIRPQSVTYFCLPGFVRQLVNTVDFLPAAMEFLENYFGVPCQRGCRV
jgi:hypothetical protein